MTAVNVDVMVACRRISGSSWSAYSKDQLLFRIDQMKWVNFRTFMMIAHTITKGVFKATET